MKLHHFNVFQDAEWVGRIHHGGRILTGFHSHSQRSQQTASFALTAKEEAVRPILIIKYTF